VAATIADDLIDTGMQAGYDFGRVSGSGNVSVRKAYIQIYKRKTTV